MKPRGYNQLTIQQVSLHLANSPNEFHDILHSQMELTPNIRAHLGPEIKWALRIGDAKPSYRLQIGQ